MRSNFLLHSVFAFALVLLCHSLKASTMKPSNPIPVPKLAEFDTQDWNAIQRAFRGTPELKFGQPWRDKQERGFRKGTVRLGWRGDRLLVFADLSDRDIVTRAKKRNDPMWSLGDVFEVFAGVHGNPAYIEYHTAPNGLELHLFWPNADALGKAKGPGGLKKFSLVDKKSLSLVRQTPKGWQVYAEIPVASLVVAGKSVPKNLEGQVWDLNFGRYDYTLDLETKILSSTSPLTVASYHRRPEWRQIVFMNRGK